MSTPSKAQARWRAKNVWQPWPGKKRRPRASPSADYTHPFSRALGRTIRAWRVAHRLKAAAVAELAQFSRNALAKLERGEAWFSANVAARVCDAMGLCIIMATCEALRQCNRFPREPLIKEAGALKPSAGRISTTSWADR